MTGGKCVDIFAGIDIGTTHIKTGVVDSKGNLLALYKADTPLAQCEGRKFYDPEGLYELVSSQVKQALGDYPELSGIGITGMAEAGLVLDRDTMEAQTDIIPWFDKCTLSLAEGTSPEEERDYLYRTGLRNSFKYGVYKYLWCLKHFGLESSKTLWLSVCDYIFYRFTGTAVTEPTFAARTYVYDIRNGCWDHSHMEKEGLSEASFPQVVPSGSFSGTLWNTRIPVALCGHDHICSAFGLIEKKGQLCNSCGTAETFVGRLDSLPEQEQAESSGLVYGPYADGKGYFGMANLSSSGQSMEWVRKNIQQQEISYEQVKADLNTIRKIPGDILYFPYLAGMGSPHFMAECSGAFLGIKAEHGRPHLLQAVIEGTCYQSRWILEKGFSGGMEEIVCTGGSTASEWWMQCKANVIQKQVIVSDVEEGTLTGAAALMQWVNGGEKISRKNIRAKYHPQEAAAVAYERRYRQKFLPAADFISRFTMEI